MKRTSVRLWPAPRCSMSRERWRIFCSARQSPAPSSRCESRSFSFHLSVKRFRLNFTPFDFHWNQFYFYTWGRNSLKCSVCPQQHRCDRLSSSRSLPPGGADVPETPKSHSGNFCSHLPSYTATNKCSFIAGVDHCLSHHSLLIGSFLGITDRLKHFTSCPFFT